MNASGAEPLFFFLLFDFGGCEPVRLPRAARTERGVGGTRGAIKYYYDCNPSTSRCYLLSARYAMPGTDGAYADSQPR
eukprot:569890-Rhodomonas_salina.1